MFYGILTLSTSSVYSLLQPFLTQKADLCEQLDKQLPTQLSVGNSSHVAKEEQPITEGRKQHCNYPYINHTMLPVRAVAGTTGTPEGALALPTGNVTRAAVLPSHTVSPRRASPSVIDRQRPKFVDLAVEELCQCFVSCGMEKLAVVCKEDVLDGALFQSLDDEILKNEPFHLSDSDLEKVNKIKEY